MTDEERHAAWHELHAATPPGWYVGRPMYHDERREWQIYAFDPSERPKVGLRSREWTTVHPTGSASSVRWPAACARMARAESRRD